MGKGQGMCASLCTTTHADTRLTHIAHMNTGLHCTHTNAETHSHKKNTHTNMQTLHARNPTQHPPCSHGVQKGLVGRVIHRPQRAVIDNEPIPIKRNRVLGRAAVTSIRGSGSHTDMPTQTCMQCMSQARATRAMGAGALVIESWDWKKEKKNKTVSRRRNT